MAGLRIVPIFHTVAEAARDFVLKLVETLGAFRYAVGSTARCYAAGSNAQCSGSRGGFRPGRVIALLGCLVLAPLSGGTAPRPPNILFILTDDQRFDAIGANGNPHINTPNLDRLAARSVRFTNANVVMSLCSPSRAAILTGRYGSSNGVTSLGAPLRAGETTFAQHLKSAGYRTGIVGKWHVGGEPAAAGFDFACYFRSNGTYFGRAVRDEGRDVRPEQHVDDYCVDRSIAFLEDAARRTEPFLLWHATQLPHMDHRNAWPSPEEIRARYDPQRLPLPATIAGDLTGKPPYLAEVRNRTQADKYGYADPAVVRGHIRDYYAVVTHLDAMIGRLLDALERLGLRENTWIVMMSDNGWFLGEHRMTSKVLAYSDSIRVPLLIAGPGLKPRVEPALALNIDVAPTLLDLAATPVPKSIHGHSLVPLLRDPAVAWRRAFVYECLDSYGGTRPMLGAMNADWSLIHTWQTRAEVGTGAPFVELYHRAADPGETRNRAADPAATAIRGQLDGEIRKHLGQIEAGSAGAPKGALSSGVGAATPAVRGELRVTTDFEGGSAKIESIDQAARIVRFMPDGDPQRGWPCWWYLRIDGVAEDERLTLDLRGSDRLSRTRGKETGKPLAPGWAMPARATFSTDGKTWRQTAPGKRETARILYEITGTGGPLWVAWGPPFTPRDTDALLAEAEAALPAAKSFELARTKQGRAVRGLRVSEAIMQKPAGVWVGARQHAWESGSCWVARGLTEWLVSGEAEARWLRQHAEMFIIPIMDVDNAATGNGGKEAVPRDHNRDWDDNPVYPEVAAVQARLRRLAKENRLDVFLDLHNPAPMNNRPFFFISPPELVTAAGQVSRASFLAVARNRISGPLPLTDERVMGPDYHPLWRQISNNWVTANGNPDTVALALETSWNTPFSTTDGYREVGRQLGRAVADYLRAKSAPDAKRN